MSLMSSAMSAESPKAKGYRFPDEWEAHRGTMMIFPAKHSYGRETEDLREEFVDIVEAIAAHEPVEVFCWRPESRECRDWLSGVSNVTVHPGDFRIDWARDHAPMLVRKADGALASAGFRTNGWGKKYRGWERDTKTRDHISRAMGWPIFHSELVLEGGSIEIGGGIGIVTESCVLNPNRTDWPKEKVEKELVRMLGLEQVIWIQSGLMPDHFERGLVLLGITTDGYAGHLPSTSDVKVHVHHVVHQRQLDHLQAFV